MTVIEEIEEFGEKLYVYWTVDIANEALFQLN